MAIIAAGSWSILIRTDLPPLGADRSLSFPIFNELLMMKKTPKWANDWMDETDFGVHEGAVAWRLSADEDDAAGSGGLDLAEPEAEVEPELKRPSMYKVILMNDDYTPMEFVVHVLEKFFGMNREKATQIMITVHTAGQATVGIFPRDVAETKSEQVNNYAQENQHPLHSVIEMTD